LRLQREKDQRTDDDDGEDDDGGVGWHALALDPAKAGLAQSPVSRSVGYNRVIFAFQGLALQRCAIWHLWPSGLADLPTRM
jgi:hypothetical protein